MAEFGEKRENAEEALRLNLRSLFESGWVPSDGFESTDQIFEKLGINKDLERGYISDEQTEKARIFFEELLNFIKRERKDPEKRDQLQNYLASLHDAAFSVSPNISNFLHLDDRILFSVSFAAIPETQGTISPSIGGGLVLDLQYMTGSREEIFDQAIKRASFEDQINIIDYSGTIGADALAQGWADETYESILNYLSAIKSDRSKSPFVHYAAKSAIESLLREQTEPSMGVVVYSGDRGVGRKAVEYTKEDNEENERIAQNIAPDEGSYAEYRMGQIAKDAVGTYDHSGTLQSIAFIDASGFTREPGQATRVDIDRVLDAVRSIRNWDNRTTWRIMDFVESKFIDKNTVKETVDEWRKIAPNVPKEVWNLYEGARIEAEEVLVESNKILQHAYNEAEAKGVSWDEVILHLQDTQGELLMPDAQLVEIVEYLSDMQEEMDERLVAPNQRLNRAYVLLSETPEFFKDISEYINNLSKEIKADKVHFDPLEYIEGDKKIIPKGATDGVDVTVLMQAIHRPDFRRQLEADIGVQLKELTMREQAQLVAFLAKNDYASIEAFATIREFGVDGARAFLSCEYGREYGEAIVKIAKSLDPESAKAIFARYAQIVDLAEKSAEELLKDFYIEDRGKQVDQGHLADELLKRAKNIIGNFAKRIDEKGPENVRFQQVLDELDKFKKDTVLFASIFKTAHKGEGDVDFESLRGVELSTQKASMISPEKREQMINIAKENYQNENEVEAYFAVESLEKKLQPNNTEADFILLTKGEDIITFLRIEKRKEDNQDVLYIGSVNTASKYRGSALGGATMEKIFDEKAKNNILTLEFSTDTDIGSYYVENGFVITGVAIIEKDGQKREVIKGKRDDTKNSNYLARAEGISHDDLKAWVDWVRIESFQFPKQRADFISAINGARENNEVASRYWIEGNSRYLAFESVKSVEVGLAA